jgi:hypothetical protein
MKKITTFFIMSISWPALIYALISLVEGNHNPYNWSEPSRYFLAFVGYFLGLVISIVLTNILNKK